MLVQFLEIAWYTINYAIVGNVGTVFENNMVHNKLRHHPLPDLTACLPKSQLMVSLQIKKMEIFCCFHGCLFLCFWVRCFVKGEDLSSPLLDCPFPIKVQFL